MKRVLITGANSYIGTSFETWVKKNHNSEITIDIIDMIDGSWKNKDFSLYDSVFHVAGIAHADIGNVSDEVKDKYYKVNTDLCIETATKAKKEGVKQFVFMSSAIIYGDSAPYGVAKRITLDTEPNPSNFYGDSKWQADKGVRELRDKNFNVVVVRSPMIYGKGSKGNYPILSKMAKRLPVFPNVSNERSMIFIENLCEFISQIIINEKDGIYFPQNAQYSCTSDIVKEIACVNSHRIFVSKIFNWCVFLASRIPGRISGIVNKAFGNMSYDQNMSEYDFDYRVVDLKESIKRTER